MQSRRRIKKHDELVKEIRNMDLQVAGLSHGQQLVVSFDRRRQKKMKQEGKEDGKKK